MRRKAKRILSCMLAFLVFVQSFQLGVLEAVAKGETMYDILIGEVSGGSVTASASNAVADAPITLTVRPDTGYHLKQLTVIAEGADNDPLTTTQSPDKDREYVFNMPSNQVSVSAEFEENVIEGEGTQESPYQIDSADDWDMIAAGIRNGEEAYTDKYYRLTRNIGVDTMIGTDENCFSGFFDGNGKLLTVKVSGTEEGVAPFQYIKDATICDLKVTGTVEGDKYCAGLVGFAKAGDQENLIKNSLVNVAITSSGSNFGGVLGNGLNSKTTIEGCAFTGSMTSSYEESPKVGVIYGWGVNGGTHRIVNCLEAGSSYKRGKYNFYPKMIYTDRTPVVAENCYFQNYYLTESDHCKNGTRSIVAGYDENDELIQIEIVKGETASSYDVSGITAYHVGMDWGERFYIGEGDKIDLKITSTSPEPEEGKVKLYYTEDSNDNRTYLEHSGDGLYTVTMEASDANIYECYGFDLLGCRLNGGFEFDDGTKGYKGSEGFKRNSPRYLVDNRKDDTWSGENKDWVFAGANGYVCFHSDNPIIPKAYQLETGNIYSRSNNPKSWKLYAKLNKSDKDWTEIACVTDDDTLIDSSYQTTDFICTNPNDKEYRYFKLEISDNHGDQETTLSEIRIWGKNANYKIISKKAVNGSIRVDDKAVEGEEVTFSALPQNKEYRLAEGYPIVKAKDGTLIECSENGYQYSFTMPVQDVTIEAEFEQKTSHAIQVSKTGEGQVLVYKGYSYSDENKLVEAYSDIEVRVETTPEAGYRIADDNIRISADGKPVDVSKRNGYFYFNMPDEPVDISVDFEKKTNHSITVLPIEHGTAAVTTNQTSAATYEGDTVTITVEKENGYGFGGVSVTDSQGKSVCEKENSSDTYTFIMPDDDVTVLVKLAYPISIEAGIENGSIGVDAKGVPGKKVSVSTVADKGYICKKNSLKAHYTDDRNVGHDIVIGADGNGNGSFTMPKYPVVISAEFVKNVIEGKGTNEEPYLIRTPADWDMIADSIREGNTDYQGKNFKLTQDISVQSAWGMKGVVVECNFDGNGHTLTYNYDSDGETEDYIAPFRSVRDSKFENLRIAGFSNAGGQWCSGLIAAAIGRVDIINCECSFVMDPGDYSASYTGGLIGSANGYSEVTIEGCVFNGKMLGKDIQKCGGFVGWQDKTSSLTVKNCVFAPEEFTGEKDGQDDSISYREETVKRFNCSDCYILTSLVNTRGSKVDSVAKPIKTDGENSLIINKGEPVNSYSVSGLTFYKSGVDYKDQFYTMQGKTVNLKMDKTQLDNPLVSLSFEADCGQLEKQGDGSYDLTITEKDNFQSDFFVTISYTLDEDSGRYVSGEDFSVLEGSGEGLEDNCGWASLLDGHQREEWYCDMEEHPYIVFKSQEPINVAGYCLTRGYIIADRYEGYNPTSWTLQGKLNETDKWVVIDSKDYNDIFSIDKNQDLYFMTEKLSGPYQYFRFSVEEIIGGEDYKLLNLGELKLFAENAHSVNVAGSVTGGAITATPTCAIKGTEITLSAEPAEGYGQVVYHVTSGQKEIKVTDGKFLMPYGDVTVNAEFTKKAELAVYSTDDAYTGSVADISITEGDYYVGDTVTLKAPDRSNDGYEFLGWYEVTDVSESGVVLGVGGQQLAKTLTYKLTLGATNRVAAVYKAAGTANVTILTQNGAKFTVNDETELLGDDENSVVKEVKLGTTVTLTAEDPDKVLQWQNESGKVLGKSASLTFVVTGDMSVTLVYKKAETGGSFVQFQTDYGQVLSGSWCTDAAALEYPVEPSKYGYTFNGWIFDGTNMNATAEAIAGKLGQESIITLVPSYTKKENRYTVTVDCVTYENDAAAGVGRESVTYSDIAIGTNYGVEAPQIDGYVFECWKDASDNILGYKNTYYIFVKSDLTLKACYKAEGTQVKEMPVIAMTNLTRTDPASVHKVIGEVTRSIPEGYTLIEHGMLYGKTDLSEEAFRYGTAGVYRYISSDKHKDGYVQFNVKVSSDDLEIYFRGYMIVKDDATGNQMTYYSEIGHGSYNGLE